MLVIALIENKAVIRKILSHLGQWVPEARAGKGPGPLTPDQPEASAQILTYHPVPDIASFRYARTALFVAQRAPSE